MVSADAAVIELGTTADLKSLECLLLACLLWRQGSSFTFYCMTSGIGVSVDGARCRLQCLRTSAKDKVRLLPGGDRRQTVHCTLMALFRIRVAPLIPPGARGEYVGTMCLLCVVRVPNK